MEILTLTAEEVEMVKKARREKARAEKVQELTNKFNELIKEAKQYNIDIMLPDKYVPICSRLNHAETRGWDIKLKY